MVEELKFRSSVRNASSEEEEEQCRVGRKSVLFFDISGGGVGGLIPKKRKWKSGN